MHSTQEHSERFYLELSPLDVLKFVQTFWKKLISATVLGGILGFSGWVFLGSYTADYVLMNARLSNSEGDIEGYALDIVSWKGLQKGLPNLATQMIEENKVSEQDLSIYKVMSTEDWWQKNAKPDYALSKQDIKELGGVSKALDSATTTITTLTLSSPGATKEKAISNVRAAAHFLRTGGAYMQIHTLLNGYESQILSTRANLLQKITGIQIEMKYQNQRARDLEGLRRQYPTNQNTNISQTISNADASGKFLPLTVQIIAANTDINDSAEKIERLQMRLKQVNLAKSFLDQALPLQDKTFDGISLVAQLLEIENNLREKLSKDELGDIEFLDTLHNQLSTIQVRFTKGLEANAAPTSSGKNGMLRSVTIGLMGGFLMMLFALLGGRIWQAFKSSRVQITQ